MDRKRWRLPLLILIILLGGFFRFYNVAWDSFQALHPDERNIAWAVTRIRFFDQLNPRFFAYGGLPIYLYRALGELVVLITNDASWLSDWGKIAVIGRYVSATLSSLTILIIYLVTTRYFSRVAGLLAAFILAFSPWAIREAHFATTETMLVFFLLLLLLISHKLVWEAHRQALRVASLGVILGLALAAKTTSILFAIIPLSALTLSRVGKTQFLQCSRFLLFFVIDLTTFLAFSPYALLDWPHFLESMRYETGVTLGKLTVPYTLQFLHETSYLYQLQTMLWQAGLVALPGTIGLPVLLFVALKNSIQGGGKQFLRELVSRIRLCWDKARRGESFRVPSRLWQKNDYGKKKDLDLDGTSQKTSRDKRQLPQSTMLSVFLIFPIFYFLWSGLWFAKFARYNVPLLPFLTITAAWIMVFIFKKLSKNKFYSFICLFGYSLIFLLHFAWGLANWTVYLRPQTRVEASRWMYSHIPPNAMIYTEHWNDGLPVAIAGEPNINFRRDLLTVYEPDNEKKLTYYGEKLRAGDFIILSTRRIWATMPRLVSKYPITSRFYLKLLSGELGYQEVATFTSYPGFFGFEVNDDSAEESIQVFDHPTVRIFQNVEKLNTTEITKRLGGT